MNSTEDMEDEGNRIIEILQISFPTAFTGLGVLLNFLSMCGILGFRELRNWSNIFIFNLALADFVGSLGILIVFASDLHPQGQYHAWTEPLFTTGLIVSILSTLAIAVQRFIIVRFDPLGSRHIITPCRTFAVVASFWIAIAVLHILVHFLEEEPVVSRITTTVVILVTLLSTVTCYGVVYCRIASGLKYMERPEGVSERGLNINKEIIITFTLVVVSTFICWLPIAVLLLFEGLGLFEDEEWYEIYDQVAFSLVCLNPVINPIIYWSRLPDFRAQLPCCCCCNDQKRPEPEKDETVVTESAIHTMQPL